ncbi:hypothetical protein Ancab_024137 [Ancistrocladus abbreviatus]
MEPNSGATTMGERPAYSILALVMYFLFYAPLILLFALWFFCVFYKCHRASVSASASASTGTAFPAAAASISGADALYGVGQSAIETLPKFTYGSEEAEGGKVMNRGATDCAVCLGVFEEKETLRLLPKCGHVFHAQCVDAWLLSHGTCPCCRAAVLPLPVCESFPGGVSIQEVAP